MGSGVRATHRAVELAAVNTFEWTTPGPWRVEETWSGLVIKGERRVALAYDRWRDERRETWSNAYLLAAAPELYTAAKVWHESEHTVRCQECVLGKVLAKACPEVLPK